MLAHSLDDSVRAEILMKTALEKAPSAYRRISALHELGNYARVRYSRSGKDADGRAAIGYWEQAVEESGSLEKQTVFHQALRVSEISQLSELYREVAHDPIKAAAVLQTGIEIAEQAPREESRWRRWFTVGHLYQKRMVALAEAGRIEQAAQVLKRLNDLPAEERESSPEQNVELFARTVNPKREAGWAQLMNVWYAANPVSADQIRQRLHVAHLLERAGGEKEVAAAGLWRGVIDYYAALDRPLDAKEGELYRNTFVRLGLSYARQGKSADLEKLFEQLEQVDPGGTAATTLRTFVPDARRKADREAGKAQP